MNGKKIAGLSAALETGKSLLFHTSLLVDFNLSLMTGIMNTPLIKLKDKGYNCFSQLMTTVKQELCHDLPMVKVMEAIEEGFEEEFDILLREDSPDEWEKKTIQKYAEKRYRNNEWIFSHRHPRARVGIGRLKSKGGLLEIYLSLSGASIESVMITGDFFSTSPDIHRLENALKWTSAREEAIEENLSKVWCGDMIYGLDVTTLTKAIMRAKENQERL